MKALIKVFAFLSPSFVLPLVAQTELDSLALVQAPIYSLEEALNQDPRNVLKLDVSASRGKLYQSPKNVNPYRYQKNSASFDSENLFRIQNNNLNPSQNNKQINPNAPLSPLQGTASQNTIPRPVMTYYYKGIYEEIPSEVFLNFPNLKYLKLRNFRLPTLDKRVEKLSKLIQLDLENSEFTRIPKEIGLLKNLQVLHLGRKPNFIPKEISSLAQLHTLALNPSFPENELLDVEDFQKEVIAYLKKNDLHFINPGDNFYQIANDYGLAYDKLLRLNGLNPDNAQFQNLSTKVGLLLRLSEKAPDLSFKKLPLNPEKQDIIKGENKFWLISQIPNLKKLVIINPADLKVFSDQVLNQNNVYLGNLKQGRGVYGSKFFDWMQNVESLDLSESPLAFIPESLTQLPKLKKLNLSGCKLNKLPNSLINLVSLEELDLSNNFLQEIPSNIHQLRALKFLDLSKNPLVFLPEEIQGLDRLQTLDLSDTQLINLPRFFGKLENLESLNLNNSLIRELPSSFGELKKLKELKLENLSFSEFPLLALQNIALERLNLNRNHINSLPDQLISLTALRHLVLTNNLFDSIPEVLSKLPLPLFLTNVNAIRPGENPLDQANPDSDEPGIFLDPVSNLPQWAFKRLLDQNKLVFLDDMKAKIRNLPNDSLRANLACKICSFYDQQIPKPGEYVIFNQKTQKNEPIKGQGLFIQINALAMEKYAQMGLDVSKKTRFKNGKAKSYYFLGRSAELQEKYLMAERYYLQWYKIRKKQKDLIKQGWSLNKLIQFYKKLKKYDSVEKYYWEWIALSERLESDRFLAITKELFDFYKAQKKYDEAKELQIYLSNDEIKWLYKSILSDLRANNDLAAYVNTLKEIQRSDLFNINNDSRELFYLNWQVGLDFLKWLDENPSPMNGTRFYIFLTALNLIDESPRGKKWQQLEAMVISEEERRAFSQLKIKFYFADIQKAASEGDAKLFKSSLEAYLEEYLKSAPEQYNFVLFQNLDQLLASGNIALASYLFQKEAKRLKDQENPENVFNLYARMLVRYKDFSDGIYLVQAIYVGQNMLDYASKLNDQKSIQRSYSALNTVISEGIKKYPEKINDISLSLEEWLAKIREDDSYLKKWLFDNLEILKNYPQEDENNGQ